MRAAARWTFSTGWRLLYKIDPLICCSPPLTHHPNAGHHDRITNRCMLLKYRPTRDTLHRRWWLSTRWKPVQRWFLCTSLLLWPKYHTLRRLSRFFLQTVPIAHQTAGVPACTQKAGFVVLLHQMQNCPKNKTAAEQSALQQFRFYPSPKNFSEPLPLPKPT